MIKIHKAADSNRVLIKSNHIVSARCEVVCDTSLDHTKITKFYVMIFGFSGGAEYARAMCGVLNEAARQVDKLNDQFISKHPSDFISDEFLDVVYSKMD